MKLFIQLKHWQLFLMLFAAPFLVEILSFFSTDTESILQYLLPTVAVFYFIVLFSWWYAIGVHLNKKLPPGVQLIRTRFVFFLCVAFGYILFICACIPGFVREMVADGVSLTTGLTDPSPLLFLLLNPLHLIPMFCVFYCLYFNSKSIVAVELQRPVSFRDFVTTFILMWFFPIGIWFIQPRINRLVSVNG